MCVNRKNNIDTQEHFENIHPESNNARIKKVSTNEAEKAANKNTSHAKRNLLIVAGLMLAIGSVLLIGAAVAFAVLTPVLVISATTLSIASVAAAGTLSIITGLLLGIIGLTCKNHPSTKSDDMHTEDKSSKFVEVQKENQQEKSVHSGKAPVKSKKIETKSPHIHQNHVADQSEKSKIEPLQSEANFEESFKNCMRNAKKYVKKIDENNDWRVELVTSELEAKFEGEELSQDDKDILDLIADSNKNTVPKYRAHHNLYDRVE
jgi:hypothetical protein